MEWLSLSREGDREDTAQYSCAEQKDGKQWMQLLAKGILIGIKGENIQ